MNDTPLNVNASPRGYISEEHKRKFTITAGILGAVFFLLQFALPFAVWIVVMPMMMLSENTWLQDAQTKRGAFWNGFIWYTEKAVSAKPSSDVKTTLKRLNILSKVEPVTVTDLFTDDPWLLPGNNMLWIISSSAIGFYQDGHISILSIDRLLGDISRPFLYKGSPAVIEDRPDGFALMVFAKNTWQKEFPLTLDLQENPCCIRDNLQVLWGEGKLHIFLKFGDTLFYREGLPTDEKDNQDSWIPVVKATRNWLAVLLEGRLTVFTSQSTNGHCRFVGLRKTDSSWESFFTYSKTMAGDIGVYPLAEAGTFALLLQSFPGSLRLVQIGREGVETEVKYGKRFPFSGGFMSIMYMPYGVTMLLPLILAIIFSSLMRKHRVCELEFGSNSIPFASLTRRALAQLIDFCIIGLPLLVAVLFFVSPLFDLEEMFFSGAPSVIKMLCIVLGGLSWLVFCLLMYSFLEGRWGLTPGKLAVRIRVLGTDLQPCGFGRALVRNLLKFVDGFFNFMIGIMIVALSENWQRVGDMAARTVVINSTNVGQRSILGKANLQ